MIYTIGHSTHTIEHFLDLLMEHGITAVCDVRSAPYSRVNPQFNRETLRQSLKDAGVAYVFLGKQLGARSDDPSCYRDGKVQYELLAETRLFREGIKRLLQGSQKYRIALMCAEKDPLHCHRTVLVARNLIHHGIEIRHILANCDVESQEESDERLLKTLKMEPNIDDLFRPREELIELAYRKQAHTIAYSVEEESGSSGIPKAS